MLKTENSARPWRKCTTLKSWINAGGGRSCRLFVVLDKGRLVHTEVTSRVERGRVDHVIRVTMATTITKNASMDVLPA